MAASIADVPHPYAAVPSKTPVPTALGVKPANRNTASPKRGGVFLGCPLASAGRRQHVEVGELGLGGLVRRAQFPLDDSL
jgi:hypothetical protein